MISKVDELESYDGGDQGFLNSYFDKVKSATMFDPNSKAVSANGNFTYF